MVAVKEVVRTNKVDIYDGEILCFDRENYMKKNEMNTIGELRQVEIDGKESRMVKVVPGNNWTHVAVGFVKGAIYKDVELGGSKLITVMCNTRGEIFYSVKGQKLLKQFYSFSALAKSVHIENGEIIVSNRIGERFIARYHGPRRRLVLHSTITREPLS